MELTTFGLFDVWFSTRTVCLHETDDFQCQTLVPCLQNLHSRTDICWYRWVTLSSSDTTDSADLLPLDRTRTAFVFAPSSATCCWWCASYLHIDWCQNPHLSLSKKANKHICMRLQVKGFTTEISSHLVGRQSVFVRAHIRRYGDRFTAEWLDNLSG